MACCSPPRPSSAWGAAAVGFQGRPGPSSRSWAARRKICSCCHNARPYTLPSGSAVWRRMCLTCQLIDTRAQASCCCCCCRCCCCELGCSWCCCGLNRPSALRRFVSPGGCAGLVRAGPPPPTHRGRVRPTPQSVYTHAPRRTSMRACMCVCVVPDMMVTTTAQGGYRVAPRTPSQVSSVGPQQYSTSSK